MVYIIKLLILTLLIVQTFAFIQSALMWWLNGDELSVYFKRWCLYRGFCIVLGLSIFLSSLCMIFGPDIITYDNQVTTFGQILAWTLFTGAMSNIGCILLYTSVRCSYNREENWSKVRL